MITVKISELMLLLSYYLYIIGIKERNMLSQREYEIKCWLEALKYSWYQDEKGRQEILQHLRNLGLAITEFH